MNYIGPPFLLPDSVHIPRPDIGRHMQTKDWDVNGKKGHLVHCGRFAEKALLQGHERNPIVNKISTIIHTNTKYLTYPPTVGSNHFRYPLNRPSSSQVLMDNTDCSSGCDPNIAPDNHAGVGINPRIDFDAIRFQFHIAMERCMPLDVVIGHAGDGSRLALCIMK
jgi:hypothetical protein